MKKDFILFLVLCLVSCKQPDTEIIQEPVTLVDNTQPVYVLNTIWKVVKNDTLAREIESLDAITEEVETHNASTTNDKWYVYVGSYPTIENSPLCDIYIVDAKNKPIECDNGEGGTFQLVWKDWPRQQMIDNLAGWEADAKRYNATLYIDVVPPAPVVIIPTVEDTFAKYTIAVVDCLDNVRILEHCSNTFRQADFPGYTLDTYFQKRLEAWNFEVICNATDNLPWHVETGKVFE